MSAAQIAAVEDYMRWRNKERERQLARSSPTSGGGRPVESWSADG